ncbi:class II fructose-bisphosphate aldolase [Mycolicibacterium sp. 624]|uniref:class II fructose-bisphosphate aldolase n=1 Tax=Mycolicibacterium sp. 624 TaxID=3156314 RepID=UPI003392C5C2
MTLLRAAAANRTAVAGFVAYNLETAQGIIAAAERTNLPVILQAGSSAFNYAGKALAAMALDLAGRTDAHVGVHLDHARTIDEVQECLDLGYTSVMFDGSHLPFDENVRLTAEATRRAHDSDAWIEGELGAIAGDEDVSTNASGGCLTHPSQAAEFVQRTSVDVLAVAVGNVHGWTPSPPILDLDLLAKIQSEARVPLALHGASGLPRDTLVACLERGVVKVNVNTELRRAYLRAVDESVEASLLNDDLVAHLTSGREAVAEAATRILLALQRI